MLDPRVWGSVFPDLPDPSSAATAANRQLVPVVGFRLCRVELDESGEPWLTGIGSGSDYRWRPGRNKATCRPMGAGRARKAHRVPGRYCGCGLYACTDPAALIRTVGPQTDDDLTLAGVIGGGRVIVHERGWRAEYAKVVAISDELPGRVVSDASGRVLLVTSRRRIDHQIAKVLGEKYNAPLLTMAGLETQMKTFGG